VKPSTGALSSGTGPENKAPVIEVKRNVGANQGDCCCVTLLTRAGRGDTTEGELEESSGRGLSELEREC
jgi:hypothetical protein